MWNFNGVKSLGSWHGMTNRSLSSVDALLKGQGQSRCMRLLCLIFTSYDVQTGGSIRRLSWLRYHLGSSVLLDTNFARLGL